MANAILENEKECSTCKSLLDLSKFCKNSAAKDGLSCICRSCISAYKKEYRKKNAGVLKEKNKRRYEQNKEKVSASQKEYYQKNKDKIKKRTGEYRESHLEYYAEYSKKYNKDNSDRIKAYRKVYYAENREHENERNREYEKVWSRTSRGMACNRAKHHERRRKMKNTKEERITIRRWMTKVLSMKTFLCYYCQERHGIKKLHIDHIDPISKGGANVIENLCTSCADCNRRKSATPVAEFNNKQGQVLLGI